MHALCASVRAPGFVCVSQEIEVMVMIVSFGSVFLGGGSIFCIYQQLLIHQHLFNCTEWEHCIHNECVWECVCVCLSSCTGLLVCRASLNTQLFHKTDPSRAVGGPNADLLK